VRLANVLAPHLVAARNTVDRAVYGTVSVLAVIAGASHDERSAGRVLAFAAVSSLVVWGVHVYAGVLADMGPAGVHWSPALRSGVVRERGVLGGVVLPLGVLSLGAIGLIDDQRAIYLSMWSGVAVLFLTPFVWLRPLGRGWSECLLASAFGGLLRLVLIWFKVVLH
jgi:hypothetical protein